MYGQAASNKQATLKTHVKKTVLEDGQSGSRRRTMKIAMVLCQVALLFVKNVSFKPRTTFRLVASRLCSSRTGGNDEIATANLDGLDDDGHLTIFPSKYMPSKEDLHKHNEIRKRANGNSGLDWIHNLKEEDLDKGIKTLEKFTTKERKQRLQQVLDGRSDHIHFVFENPSNANNVWAALRSFDSFGIQSTTVIIDESAYDGKWRREVMGSAMGSQKWLTLKESNNTRSALTELKAAGYRIVVSDIHTSSKSVHDVDWKSSKCAVIMGNEEMGCSEIAKELADERFYIPMKGFCESLNLSVGKIKTMLSIPALLPHVP